MPQSPQELRRIIAGSSRFHAFLELLESLRNEATDITKPLPTKEDSLEIRRALVGFIENELDLLRRIPNNPNAGRVAARRDDT